MGKCNVVILEVNLRAKIISDKDNNYQIYFEVQISQIREAYGLEQCAHWKSFWDYTSDTSVDVSCLFSLSADPLVAGSC